MSCQTFSIGKDFAVAECGRMYFKGAAIDNKCNHRYGVYLESFSFEEIEKNEQLIRVIVIGIQTGRAVTYKHIMFYENSKYFDNMTWEEYKEKMKCFLHKTNKWAFKNSETYFC